MYSKNTEDSNSALYKINGLNNQKNFVFTLCFIELYIAKPRNQNAKLSINLSISSINEKQSLIDVIKDVEYEIGVLENFLYMIAVRNHCKKSQKKTFDKVYCFACKVASPQTDRFVSTSIRSLCKVVQTSYPRRNDVMCPQGQFRHATLLKNNFCSWFLKNTR